jgi:DNA-binding SARP family transcriptional activator
MAPTVLRTRLVAPRLPDGCLARPALSERAARGLEGRVVAVVAGPGYGKTTLLVQALEAQRRPWVWCSCDDRLATGGALVAHLAAGFAQSSPGFGAGLSPRGTIDEQVAALVNELHATVAEETVLALDDVHLLPPETAAALALLGRTLPAGVRLLVASRSTAAVPRPAGDPRGLLELGEADLALTESEAAALAHASGAGLSTADLTRLHRLTEGWVAGVVLAARPAGVQLLSEGEPAFEDLIRQALAGQGDEVHAFVLDTAPLDRFTPEMAWLVSGRRDAASICRRLVSDRLFTARLRGPGEWYRYHHLFASYLRRELSARDPVRLEALHRRAAMAWRAAGQPLEAVRHHVEAGDWAGAADALEPVAEDLATSPDAETLDAWLRAMPGRHVGERPSLILARATLLLGRADHEASFAAYEQAVETLLARGDHERAAVALFRLLQAMLAAGTRPDLRAAVGARWLARLDPSVRMAPAVRVVHAIGCAYARRFDEASVELEAAVAAPRGPPVIPVYAAAVRAHFIGWAREGRPEALEALDEPIEVLERNPARDQLAFTPWMHLLRGYLLNDLGRHEEALDETSRALEAARRRGLARTQGRMVAWVRSVALAGLERWDDLEAELAPPDLMPAPHEATSYSYRYRAAAALLSAARADHAATTTHVRLGREGLRAFGTVSDDPMFLCDFAVAAHRVGEAALATDLVTEARDAASDIGAAWQRARAALVGAAVHGDATEADALLQEALTLTADAVFEPLWTARERRFAAPLLARALKQDLGPPGRAGHLLARCGGDVLTRCASDLEDAAPAVRVRLAEAAAEAVAADGQVLDGLLRDRDASVRAAARESWTRLRERPRAALRIVTLGELRVWRDDVPLPNAAFGRQKARALLGLLLAWGRAVHRDELCEALWAGLRPERASAALRTTLHDLRRALHPELDAASPAAVVVADGEAVRIALSERDGLDLADLDAAAAALRAGTPTLELARLEEIVALYRGPLLSEWPYEEWARPRREEAEEAYRAVLESLAKGLAAAGHHQAAAGSWQRLIAMDPEREGWHRGLMRAYAAGGERALALRQFHACRAVLRRRQGIEPGAETRTLYSAILKEEDLPPLDPSVTLA